VDSAVTIGDINNPYKVYEDAEKIFQMGTLPVGVAIYGAAAFGQRTIGSYLREFEIRNPSGVLDDGKQQVGDIVEELRAFFMGEYAKTMVPMVEAAREKKFEDIPDSERPGLGLIVAGFSPGAFLPEVWNIQIPLHSTTGTPQVVSKDGAIGSAWFASYGPIARYIKGWDPGLMGELLEQLATLRGAPLTEAETGLFESIAQKYEYQIVFDAMPIRRGVDYVRFLVQLVISHHKFAVGASIVGGSPRIGVVTYKGGKFRILEANDEA
jgi:hypothetical protein